jgi:hypothetical protein
MSKKSRRLIRSTPVAVPVAEPAAAASVVTEIPEREYYFLPEVAPDAVDEKELHDLVKEWRHGRATRRLLDAIQDAYVTIFSVAMIGAMVTNLVLQAQANVANCAADSCLSARTLVPWAALAGAFALTLGLSRLFGPVLASAAEGFWLMDAPISRRRLLGGRLVLAVSAAGGIGALLGGLIAALTGSAPLAIGLWALANGLGCAALIAFAAAEQGIERHQLVRAVQGVFAGLGIATMLLVVSIAAGWVRFAMGTDLSVPIASVVSGLGLVVLVAALLLAFRRLDQIRRARLLSGGSLVSGMQGAMFALDFGLVRDILVERDAVARGHVKPTKGRGVGLTALVWRDLQRVVRFPRSLIGLVISLVVPYAVDALGLAALTPFLSGLVLVAVLVPFLSTLRVLSRTGGLARMFPFKTSQLRTAAMVVPFSLAFVWQLAAIPAFIGISSAGAERAPADAVLVSLATGMAGLLGAVRWVTAKPVDFKTPMVATESGALPPTLIFNLFRGFDMVALITAPVMFGASPVWSLLLAAVVFIGLRGTFNMEELRAEQEVLQREAAAAKAQRAGEKIKIPKPAR